MIPEFYWEKRCMITEDILDGLLCLLLERSPEISDGVVSIMQKWEFVLTSLDEEVADNAKHH